MDGERTCSRCCLKKKTSVILDDKRSRYRSHDAVTTPSARFLEICTCTVSMCCADSQGNPEQPFCRQLQKDPKREEGAESHIRKLVNDLHLYMNIDIKIMS